LSEWERERRLENAEDIDRRLAQVKKRIVEFQKEVESKPCGWWHLTPDQLNRMNEISKEIDEIGSTLHKSSREDVLDQIKKLEFRRRD
jgi:hypothetical protein